MSVVSSRLRVELRRARRSAIVLAVGIAAAVISAGIVISKENVHLPWQGEESVQVAVANATGVVPGLDEVRWAGIVVGRITGVRFVNSRPVLSAELDPSQLGGAVLYHDATVVLRPQTPLSDMYLDVISRGHSSAGALGSGQILPATQTSTPVDVADILNTFSEPIRTRLQELLNELATGLSPAGGQQLRQSFAELASLLVTQKRLSGVLATRRTLVSGLVHASRQLFDALSSRDTELTRLLGNGAGTLRALAGQDPALSSLIAQLPGTLSQVNSSFGQLRTTLADVRPALTQLLPTARQLPAGLRALSRFALAATPALRALNPAATALEPLAVNLAPTSSTLRGAFVSLAPQAPQLDAITAKLVPCELPVDKFFAWSLSVLKFGNAGNLTASPRGVLVAGPFEDPTLKDPSLAPTTGCADGASAPTSTTR